MTWMLDTNILIHIMDGNAEVIARVDALTPVPQMSAITRIEIENGVYRSMADRIRRRALVDDLLQVIDVLPFEAQGAAAYGAIVAALGYSRAQTLDRMIAAHAIAQSATLVTNNARDFRAIPSLALLEW